MVSKVSADRMGVIQPEVIPCVRNILEDSGDVEAIGLFDELVGRVYPSYELWEVMAGMRHLVYQLGLAGGDKAIGESAEMLRDAVSLDQQADSFCETELDFHQRFLVVKTATCLRALAAIESEKRARILGMTRARFLKPNSEKTSNDFFEFDPETNQAIRMKRHISADTSVNELMDILAFIEQNSSIELNENVRTEVVEFLIRQLVTGNDEINKTASRFLRWRHFQAILDQMPDTLSYGRIGGKSTGLLIAYAALEQKTPDFDHSFHQRFLNGQRRSRFTQEDFVLNLGEGKSDWFEIDRSAFVGTEIFKAVLHHDTNPDLANACLIKGPYKRDKGSPVELHNEVHSAMMKAEFPEHLERQLMILFHRYWRGRTPIIVRSSSELEDRHGASFAGLYESVELANSGSFEEDFGRFKQAILTIYASVFNPEVMEYRRQLDLLSRDEEMGVLIQRLNGAKTRDYFYPDVSIVAMSYATQSVGHDPERGAMRVVAGLGRSAVDEAAGRYVMFEKPDATYEGQGAQVAVSVLNLSTGKVERISAQTLTSDHPNCSKGMYQLQDRNKRLTFNSLVQSGSVLPIRIEYIVQKLKHQLGYEVDCEFTAQWDPERSDWTVKLVQCRPQTIPLNLVPSRVPDEVEVDQILVQGEGAVNGTRLTNIRHVLYIDPKIFTECTAQERFSVPQLVSELNARFEQKGYLIIAPRSWGSHDFNSGIGVRQGDFSNAAGVIEVWERGESVPSFGAHFLQVLFDCGTAYSTFNGDAFQSDFFTTAPHAPDFPVISEMNATVVEKLSRYIKVIDVDVACRGLGILVPGRSDRPFVMHLAQDPTTGKGLGDHRPATLYIARENQSTPIPVEERARE